MDFYLTEKMTENRPVRCFYSGWLEGRPFRMMVLARNRWAADSFAGVIANPTSSVVLIEDLNPVEVSDFKEFEYQIWYKESLKDGGH